VSGIAARAGPSRIPVRRRASHPLTPLGRRGGELLVAVAVYFAFACFFTWPLVTGLGHIFYGAAGDPYGSMAFYRELVDHGHNPFLPGTISQFAAPEGQAIPWARDLASLPGILTPFLLTAAFGPIAANGVFILLGFTLTGSVMFVFMRRLIDNAWVALLCGWALAFYPFAVLNAQGHYDYVQTWALVLGLWRMVELHWLPSRRNAVLAGLAVAFGMSWSPYFILLGGVAYMAALIASVALTVGAGTVRATLRAHAVTAGIVVVFAAFLGALATAQSGNSLGVRTNALAQFNTYSARPLEYLLPDRSSPLFGSMTTGYLNAHIHGSNFVESTLYLGGSVIILALVAGAYLLRGRLRPGVSSAAVILVLVAVAALVTSAPPEARILGLEVPFPSHFIMKVTTTWRAYSRFVAVAMIAVTALAGIGLDALTRGRRTPVRIAVLLAASILIPLDLWSRLPAPRTNTYAAPRVYTTLAHQPPGLTAEYPLAPAGYNTYNDLFFQNVHRMPMINGYAEGSVQEHRALSLANLADPSTAPRLAALGVRYVIEEMVPPVAGVTSPGVPGRGFRLIYRDSYAALYAVTASPSGPELATPDVGFDDNEDGPDGLFNWLGQPSGTIELAGRCPSCGRVLGMTVASFARPRMVTVSVGRRVLLRRRVSQPVQLEIQLPRGPFHSVTIATTPGPQSVAKTLGGLDTRRVSVQVSHLTITGPTVR
jgi:hypothetical protein